MLYHPQNSENSHQYYSLSRAALMIDDPVINATLTMVETLTMHIVYVRMAEGPGYGSKAWVLLGSTLKLAQMVSPAKKKSVLFRTDVHSARITVRH